MLGQAPIPGPRLYVFDCGTLTPNREGVERYHVTIGEVGETRMPVPCFLIAHPRGTLMWDVGVIPDAIVEAQPQGAKANVNPTVAAVVTRTLKSQLAQAGFTPEKVTYVAISHAHIDHTANLNAFAGSAWRPRGRSATSCGRRKSARQPDFYTALANSKTVYLEKDEHDVFGDGSVVIKAAPGHTPGHQVRSCAWHPPGASGPAGDSITTRRSAVQSRAARQRVQRRTVRRVTTPHRGI